jgi:hypothetical protein
MTLDELEKLAREATQQPRVVISLGEDGHHDVYLYPVNESSLPLFVCDHSRDGYEPFRKRVKYDAELAAAANPAVVLALVAVARRAETMRNAFVNGHDSIAAVTLAKLGEDITALTAALATR